MLRWRRRRRLRARRRCGCAERFAANCERGLRVGSSGWGLDVNADAPDHVLLHRALVESTDEDIIEAGLKAIARELRVVWCARQMDGGGFDEEIDEVESAIIGRLEVLAALQGRTVKANLRRYMRSPTARRARAEHEARLRDAAERKKTG